MSGRSSGSDCSWLGRVDLLSTPRTARRMPLLPVAPSRSPMHEMQLSDPSPVFSVQLYFLKWLLLPLSCILSHERRLTAFPRMFCLLFQYCPCFPASLYPHRISGRPL